MSRNVGRSVNQKLKNISKQTGWNVEALRMRYVLERFLYRMSLSSWQDHYALKGGILVSLWNGGDLFRSTTDIDFNGLDKNGTIEDIELMILEVIETDIGFDDGVQFNVDDMIRAKTHEGKIPGGKVKFDAMMDSANIKVRIDVGFGNAITPEIDIVEYPLILDDDHFACVYAYPVETTLSEKFHAMIRHGYMNTRLKDYYDCWALSQMIDKTIDKNTLSLAIHNTFMQQVEDIPSDIPSGLSDKFISQNEPQWDKFVCNEFLCFEPPPFEEIVRSLRALFVPACQEALLIDNNKNEDALLEDDNRPGL